jgi:hypothetical protein
MCVCVCVCLCVCVYEDDYHVTLWGTDLNFVHLKESALHCGWHNRHLCTKDVVRSMASSPALKETPII